jgi:hypothetical protein
MHTHGHVKYQIGTPHDNKFNRAWRRSSRGTHDLKKGLISNFLLVCSFDIWNVSQTCQRSLQWPLDLKKVIKCQISDFLLLCSSDKGKFRQTRESEPLTLQNVTKCPVSNSRSCINSFVISASLPLLNYICLPTVYLLLLHNASCQNSVSGSIPLAIWILKHALNFKMPISWHIDHFLVKAWIHYFGLVSIFMYNFIQHTTANYSSQGKCMTDRLKYCQGHSFLL